MTYKLQIHHHYNTVHVTLLTYTVTNCVPFDSAALCTHNTVPSLLLFYPQPIDICMFLSPSDTSFNPSIHHSIHGPICPSVHPRLQSLFHTHKLLAYPDTSRPVMNLSKRLEVNVVLCFIEYIRRKDMGYRVGIASRPVRF